MLDGVIADKVEMNAHSLANRSLNKIYVDFTKLNQETIKDPFPTPFTE
jgi:hypothetical protein